MLLRFVIFFGSLVLSAFFSIYFNMLDSRVIVCGVVGHDACHFATAGQHPSSAQVEELHDASAQGCASLRELVARTENDIIRREVDLILKSAYREIELVAQSREVRLPVFEAAAAQGQNSLESERNATYSRMQRQANSLCELFVSDRRAVLSGSYLNNIQYTCEVYNSAWHCSAEASAVCQLDYFYERDIERCRTSSF